MDDTKSHSPTEECKSDDSGEAEDSLHQFEEKDEHFYPEGGRGWGVLVGTFMITSVTYGIVQSFGVYELHYQTQFPDAKSSAISVIGALQPFFIYVGSIPSVAVVNVIGVKWSIVVGYLIMSFSLMMLSISSKLWHFYLCQGVAFGLGAGLLFFVAMIVPPEWFRRRRSLANGITATGSSLGGIIWPIVIKKLFNSVGFGWTNRIMGFIFLPMMAATVVAVQTRLPQQKRSVWPNVSVLKNYRYTLISAACGVAVAGYFTPLFYIAVFASRMNPPAKSAIINNIITIANSTSIFGRTLVTLIADRYGRLNLLIITMLLTGISQLAFWLPAAHSEALVVVFAMVFGLCSSPLSALVPSVVAQLFGLDDLFTSRLSINFLMCGIGSLIGPTVAGTFLPQSDSHPGLEGFSHMIAFVSSVILAGAAGLIALRFTYTRKIFIFI